MGSAEWNAVVELSRMAPRDGVRRSSERSRRSRMVFSILGSAMAAVVLIVPCDQGEVSPHQGASHHLIRASATLSGLRRETQARWSYSFSRWCPSIFNEVLPVRSTSVGSSSCRDPFGASPAIKATQLLFWRLTVFTLNLLFGARRN